MIKEVMYCGRIVYFSDVSDKEMNTFDRYDSDVPNDLETLQYVAGILDTFECDDDFIDIGAHMGVFSFLINKGSCIAIEPTRHTYQLLLKNCLLNQGRCNVIALNYALYDERISYVMQEDGSFSGLNSLLRADSGEQTILLDDLPSLIYLKNVRLIKIDAEWSDDKILRGGLNLIKKYLPVIVVENKYDDDRIKRILEPVGYNNFFGIGENLVARVI